MSKIVIVIEGGLVQQVITEQPAEVLILDYDTEGVNADEIVDVPQGDGIDADGIMSFREVEVHPERVAELFNAAKNPEVE